MLRPRKGMMSGPSMALPPADTRGSAMPGMMSAGGVKGAPTKQAPIVKPEIERAPPKPLPETKESASAPAPAPEPAPAEMTFTFVEGKERGDAAQNYLYGQEGEVQQLTVSELRDYFESDKVNRLPEVFGTFDNYLAYMTEREQLIQSGDYDVGSWSEADTGFSEDQEMILEGDADLTIDPSDPGQNLENLRRQQTSTQQGAYNNWINSEANQALLQKYGVNPVVYSDSGDKFAWNGSAYVKVVDESGAGAGDFVKIGLAIAAGVATGGAASSALSSALGATGSAAVGAGLGSAVSQGIATGEVDLEKALIAAVTAGIGAEFTEFLEDQGVLSSTEEAIARAEDSISLLTPGTARYEEAIKQLDILRGSLEAVNTTLEGSDLIINLAGGVDNAISLLSEIENNVEEFSRENEDAAWQAPDVKDVIGAFTPEDLQIQTRDYISELEEQREESGEAGQTGAQPVEDIFADTTAEETGLEAESTITEEMFSEYFPQPVEGPQGDPGRDGVDGIDGVDGRDGVDGVDGIDGRDGIDGTDGRDGVDGRDGIDGRDADPEAVRGIVESVVNQAISNIPPGTSTEEVQEIVNNAIGGLNIPEGMTTEQVRQIIGTALENFQFPPSVTQEQVDEVVGGVRSDLETATTELGTSILGVQREVSEVERSLTEALEAATLGQSTALSDSEARLLEQLTGVEADILQQMAESDAGLEAGLFDLGTNINQVRADLQSQLQTTQQQTEESLEQASDERRDLQLALIAVGGDVNRLDAQTRQQFEEFGENVNQLFTGVNVDIEGLQAGQVSQAEAFAQYQEEAAIQAEEATEDRRNLQQAIIGAQGDIEQLDENTRQQFEEFGGTVNDLFSDVNVDIEALQEGQISQAEAQQAFQQSTEEQFGEIGGQIGDLGTQIGGIQSEISGIGRGLEGLGQGVAGLGAGLGAGLLGLAAQQEMLPGQIAAATPIDPVEFEKFQRGLTRRKLADPLRIGMFTGGARNA